MDIQEVIDAASQGEWQRAYVLVGPERFLVERAIARLRAAVVGDGSAGFNDDIFHGSDASGRTVVDAARTLPMMAQARFTLVREADSMASGELDAIASYLEDPAPSTCLVLAATKLDGRGRLARTAKSRGWWVDASPLKGRAVRRFAVREAKARGHRMDDEAADTLVDSVGEDLSAVGDAVERLSLYVGAEQPIDRAAVETCVTRVRTESIWALVDAVSARDSRTALRAAGSMLSAREPPLRILAMVARQLRLIARMRQSLAAGARPADAAKEAGVPGFKAREMAEAARRYTGRELGRAFTVLAETDLDLKGSRRPPDIVLEEALVRLCHTTPA